MKLTLTMLTAGLFLALPAYASLPQCDAVVTEANALLARQGKPVVQDEKKLVALLRTLNRDGVLPAEYVTRDQARRVGWSGKDSDSLWSIWMLNKKQLGGDLWTGKPLPIKATWRTADLDTVRGYHSNKQLIFSAESATRYLTPDNGGTLVTLDPCQ